MRENGVTQLKAILLSSVLTLVFILACNEDDEGSEVSQGFLGGPNFVTLTAEQIGVTLEGFVEAFANGDTEQLTTYWSRTCGAEQIARSNTAATLLGGALAQVGGEGQYSLTVDAAKLEIQVIFNHVMVELDQPEGVLQATLGGNPFGEEAEPLLLKMPLDFVREGGEWKVATCDLTGDSPDEEQEEERDS